jgi:hypothetical protein
VRWKRIVRTAADRGDGDPGRRLADDGAVITVAQLDRDPDDERRRVHVSVVRHRFRGRRVFGARR